jgi:hypothetical protein
LGGICNLKYSDDRLACKDTLAGPFLSNEGLDRERQVQGGEPIMKVRHEGFSLPFIRRDVVKRIKFTGIHTTAVDYCFALWCYKLKIPIHVDTRARLLHLCEQPPKGLWEYWGVGIKEPYLRFEE